jgi:hypothetical protein
MKNWLALGNGGRLFVHNISPLAEQQEVTQAHKTEKASTRKLVDAYGCWLLKRDAQQNFFVYHFGILLNPVKKNHPRTAYMMTRMNPSNFGS